MYLNPFMQMPPHPQMAPAPAPQPVALPQYVPQAAPQSSPSIQTLGSALAHQITGKPMPAETAQAQDPSLFASLGQRAASLLAPQPAAAPVANPDGLAQKAMDDMKKKDA